MARGKEVEDDEGQVWYERTLGHHINVAVASKDDAVIVEMLRYGWNERVELGGWKVPPGQKLHTYAAQSSDEFMTNRCTVLADGKVWLTEVQDLRQHAEDLEAQLKEAEAYIERLQGFISDQHLLLPVPERYDY